MSRYIKLNGYFDDTAFKDDIKIVEAAVSLLDRLGVKYEYKSSFWVYNPEDVEFHREDVLKQITIGLGRKYQTIENLRAAWPEVSDMLVNTGLKFNEIDGLYQQLRDRWQLLKRIQNREKKLSDSMGWSWEERDYHLGPRAGIEMTVDVLQDFELKLEYVAAIWGNGGAASLDMSSSYLESLVSVQSAGAISCALDIS